MDFDSNSLRIFCATIEFKSFSVAAKNLKLSQPSVSQMISRIEEKLGNLLFERIGHAVVPTRLAGDLYKFSITWLEQLDHFSAELTNKSTSVSGKVRFAKPESCLWTPQYELILKQLRNLQGITLDIEITTNDKIIDGVLEDKYDFGFIIGERLSSELRFEKFSEEFYVAAQSRTLNEMPSFSKNSRLRLVTYPGWENYFKIWLKHHGLSKMAQNWELQSVVNVNNLAGALKAMVQGAGMCVLPLQCVASNIDQKEVTVVDPSEDSASSPVYLIKRRSYTLPARVKVVLDKLREVKV